MAGRREASHVDPDLGQDDFRSPVVDAWDGIQEPDLSCERDEAPLDLLGEPLDSVLEILDVREQLTDEERVVRVKVTLQRFAKLRELLAQLAFGELGKDRRIAGAPRRARRASLARRPRARPRPPSSSLTPASWRTLSRRWTSRVRSWMSALR